ncbi:histidine kinase [Ornithinibacillus californiensis]|uniref:histidine kinase n=1 Tax=Ornithinibacillus californiensis TaxID=161536 RepID=UPI00064D993D|nr:histidine kinase [Ornithinibacillus californiensis]
MNRTKVYFIAATLLMMIVIIFYYLSAMEKTSSIKLGELDLSETEFDSKGVIELNGEWEFYWNQLLAPTDFIYNKQRNYHYAYVPGNWLQDLEGNTYPDKGYATYRATIKNIPKTKYFGLKKGNIRNSSKIYVNGELILKDGNVSKDLAGSVAGNNSEVVYFEIEDSTAEIIIQVANHEYIVGGIAKPIIFGTQEELMQQNNDKIMFEFAMILIVVIIGIFYLLLFLASNDYRKKEPVTLPLALSSLSFGVMNGIYSERIIMKLFPDITLDLTFRFGHFMNALSVIMVVIVVNKVSAAILPSKIRNYIISFFGLFLVFVLTLPLEIYLNTLSFYMFSAVGIFFSIWLRTIILYVKNNSTWMNDIEHATLIVVTFCTFLFWFDMTLYSIGLKVDLLVSFLTIPVYSIALAALLIVRYTNSYKKNEELSIQLLEAFSSLDQTTKEVQRNELAFLQAQIAPHFLFNALSSIISLCYTNGEKAAKLLMNLSDYLRRSFDIDLKTDMVTIENELKLIEAYIEIEKARFGRRIQVVYDIDPEVLPVQISPLIIEPLVENAIRHGVLKNKHGGKVKLTIRKRHQAVFLSIEDNGKGMDIEQIKAIQNEEMNDLISSQGNGISLMNVYMRLKNRYDVKLNFDTTGSGTKVHCTIPIQERYDKEEDHD